MAENRLVLAELLASLLEQQQARRKDLKHLLEEMELQRQHQAADYWLVQYQRLMESMPQSVAQMSVDKFNSQPSAPPLPPDDYINGVEPSAPADVFAETTCVICLDSQVNSFLIF